MVFGIEIITSEKSSKEKKSVGDWTQSTHKCANEVTMRTEDLYDAWEIDLENHSRELAQALFLSLMQGILGKRKIEYRISDAGINTLNYSSWAAKHTMILTDRLSTWTGTL